MVKIPLLLLTWGMLCLSCGSNNVETESVSEQLSTQSIPEKITFMAEDGVEVHANLYPLDKNSPVILLCHEAGKNKWEYREIAFKLFDMGYNCLAIDQRNGGNFLDSVNLTRQSAMNLHKSVGNMDVLKDINAAINWLESRYTGKVLLWGSEQSASLALKEGFQNENVSAVIALSPSRQLAGLDITQQLADWKKPLFVTSSNSGSTELRSFMKEINHQSDVTQFVPKGEGCEGTCALTSGHDKSNEYWLAITSFLKDLQ